MHISLKGAPCTTIALSSARSKLEKIEKKLPVGEQISPAIDSMTVILMITKELAKFKALVEVEPKRL